MTSLRLGLARAAADEQIGVALADGRAGKSRRHGRPRGEIRRQLDFFRVIQIEKSLRRGRRAVRFHKSARDEKRLVLVFAQILNRAVGGVIIAVAFAVAVQHDDAVGIRGARIVRGQRRQHAVRLRNLRARNFHGVSDLPGRCRRRSGRLCRWCRSTIWRRQCRRDKFSRRASVT